MQDGKQYQAEYDELNIKDLVWSVLCRWRILIAAFLLGGILLAAFTAFKDYRIISNEKTVKDRKLSYETELASYKEQKELLESDLKTFRSVQEWQQYYRKNALMLQLDPYNASFISASFCLEADKNAQDPAVTGAILRQYHAALDQLDLDPVIADAAAPELTAVNPAGTEKRLLEAEVDAANTVLTVKICADTAERAEKIYAAAKEALEAQHKVLEQNFGEHRLTEMTEQKWSGADAELVEVQTVFRSGLSTYNSYVTDTEKSLNALKAPTSTIPTFKTMIRKAVKYGIIGAAAGLFLAAAFLMVKLVLEDRLNSTDEIAQRYGLPVLGTQTGGRKLAKLDRAIAGKLGIDTKSSEQAAAEFTAANVKMYLKDGGELLLAGTCGEEKLNAVKQALAPLLEGVGMTVVGNVNDSAEAVSALRENGAVICVEEWKKAAHKEIRRELQTVGDSASRNLGVIVTL